MFCIIPQAFFFFHNYFIICFIASYKSHEGPFLGSSWWEPHGEPGREILKSSEEPTAPGNVIPFTPAHAPPPAVCQNHS